jgi:hypothetical protein
MDAMIFGAGFLLCLALHAVAIERNWDAGALVTTALLAGIFGVGAVAR